MFKPYKFRVNRGRLQKDFRYRTVEGGNPLISWGVLGGEAGAYQSAYRVRVSCGTDELWDSGWVECREQSALYAGKELPRGKRIDFSVKLRDNFGNESEEGSDWFIRGDADGWNAVWIGASEDIKRKPVYFRRDFTVDTDIVGGCLYICGLGYHKAYLNGAELDPSVLDPAHSDYTKTCYYAVIPVDRSLLSQGVNTLGVIVAEGWRRNDEGLVPKAIGDRKIAFFGPHQLAARLELFTSSGEKILVETGDGWLWTHGAITHSNMFDGEIYDASADIPGWNLPDSVPECFKDSVILPPPGGALRPMTLEPIREGQIWQPLEIYSLSRGVHIVDFGQNIAGVVRLKLPRGLACGHKITISHAEMLDEDGNLYTAPLRDAKATDTYIAAGDQRDLDVWQPMFTYHGFRYARVEGLETLDRSDICAISLHTDLENSSHFSCGSALVNKIHQNIVMTERANMHSILTDCPQRDERMQWLNDATVRFEETPYNFEIGRMFPKITQDVIDAQHEDGAFTCCSPYVFGGLPADPVCSSFLVAGREALRFLGDVETVRRAYAHYEAWENLLLSRSTGYIVDYSYYGDWAGPAYACVGDEGAVSAVTPGQLMSTGYSYFNCKQLADFARLLGMPEKESHWNETADKIREAYLAQWYNPETGVVATGSQAAQAFSLWLDILPEEGRAKAAQVMRNSLVENSYKITTGNLCTRYLLDMLAKYGYTDDAWKLLLREDYPSFGYQIQNEATTIWERFELKKNPGMNSHCHPMYGAAGYWLYAWLCGIRNIRDGFAFFDVDPVYPTGLLHAHAVVDTPRGELSVKWTRRYGKLRLYVNVPFGCEARVVAGGENISCHSGFHVFEWEE